MKSVIGNNIIFSLFGESHSELMGITIHNLPSGLKIDEERIARELQRRRPDGKLSNARFEDDKYQIISGLFNSFTTGAPLTIIVNNQNEILKKMDKIILLVWLDHHMQIIQHMLEVEDIMIIVVEVVILVDLQFYLLLPEQFVKNY